MSEPSPPARRSRCWRRAFLVYATLLFIATHWPKADLSIVPIRHPDKYLHAVVFALWTVLLGLSGLVGDIRRGRALLLAGVIAVAFSAFDEATQAIPVLHRHATPTDFAFNVLGVAAGIHLLVIGKVIAERPAARAPHRTEGISGGHEPKTPAPPAGPLR